MVDQRIKIENATLVINTTGATHFTNKFNDDNNVHWEPKLAIIYFIEKEGWLLTLALNGNYLVEIQVIKLQQSTLTGHTIDYFD